MFVAAVGFVGSVPAGCASGPASGGTAALSRGRPALEPVESLIAVCPGSTVVIPVQLNGSLPSGGTVQVRFGEGPPVRGTMVWIGVRLAGAMGRGEADGPSPAPFAAAWMGPAGEWSATPASQATRPASAGTWAVVVEAPVELAGARMLRIADWPTPMIALPEGCRAGLFALNVPVPPGVPAETVRAMRGSPWLARTLDAQNRSPLNRWRARLAWRLLDGGVAASPAAASWDVFADPVIEALARQGEWRWAAGLARVASADPALAAALAWRIAAVADLGGGVAMPVWPAEGPSLGALGEDLLSPMLGDAEVVARARAWLDEQPEGVAWVVDDGGASDALTGGLIATVAVTNLDVEPAVAWAAHERAERVGELTPAPARSTARITAAAPVGAAPGGAAELGLGLGDHSTSREVVRTPVPVAPPGLRIGPLLPEWSLASWMANGSTVESGVATGEPFDEAWVTMALLYREPAGEPGSAAEGRELGVVERARWMMYVECRRAPAGPDAASTLAPPPAIAGTEVVPGLGQVRRPGGSGLVIPRSSAVGAMSAGEVVGSEEELRVWLGPMGAPSAVLRITSTGMMVDELGGGADASGVVRLGRGERVSTRVEPEMWACWVPIPERCIEASRVLRVSIERTDARGVRTAWPRRMLPWQREPGRAAVDVGGWPD